MCALDFAFALVNLAGLSFLGLGVEPGTPDWGRMLFENRNILFSNPVGLLLPGRHDHPDRGQHEPDRRLAVRAPDQMTATSRRCSTVRGLSISATRRQRRTITTGTDLEVGRGETVAIVGESGSGKSLTAKAIGRLLPPGVTATGSIRFDGIEVLALPEREMRPLRGRRISLLLQDPFTMMNPLMHCGKHIEEMLRGRSALRRPRGACAAEVARRLAEVGIDDPRCRRPVPFQLSGGMCQRVALAASLARDPELLIADEPSTALDVTTQAEIMKLLKRVQAGARHEPDPDHPRPAPRLLDLRPRPRALCRLAARGRRRAARSSAIPSIPTRSACCCRSRRPTAGCRS